MNETDLNSILDQNIFNFMVMSEFRQLDMSSEDALTSLNDFQVIRLFQNKRSLTTMQLSPNVFEDNKDVYGFADEYFVEETEFVTIDKVAKSEELITTFDPLLKELAYPGTNQTMPSARLLIELSDTRSTYKREPYSFFALLGDFGGFNGAIIMFPALIMSFYTPRMYAAAVA